MKYIFVAFFVCAKNSKSYSNKNNSAELKYFLLHEDRLEF